jgi:hypothetical protein
MNIEMSNVLALQSFQVEREELAMCLSIASTTSHASTIMTG